jgi:hypothetical protein
MIRRKVSALIPAGLLVMAAALILQRWGARSDFIVGVLMGASIGLMIVGLVRQTRCPSK